jgi:hypothetical protein
VRGVETNDAPCTRLASLGLGPWLLFSWDKTNQHQLSASRLCRGSNEESVLIVAFADDQNVYDVDRLNFKLE